MTPRKRNIPFLIVLALTAGAMIPDDRSFTRHAVAATSSPIAVSLPSDSFDWPDAVVGGAFGMALAFLGLGALLIAQRRRTLRPA